MKKIIILLMSFSLFLLVGCSNKTSGPKKNDGIIVVTTTTSQIADAVKNIGGDKVKVVSLMGPGTDPHLYKATQGDIEKLQSADIIFYNGLHLEGKMLEIFEKINETKPTYPIADSIMKDKLISNSNAVDPHIWFDIDLWKSALMNVTKGLQELDPKNKDYYEQNAQNYFKKLDELKAYAEEEMNKIPKQQKILVTAHDAFSYFGAAYGMEVMGLQGLSTDAEYGLGDVQSLVEILVSKNIKAVFIESSISERSINAVIEGAKKKGHDVEIGGELYSDAMGAAGTEEGTYIGMYKHNIDTIVNSLK